MTERNINEGQSTEKREDEIEKSIESLLGKLPDMAKELIKNKSDFSNEENQRFYENLDDPNEHSPRWHQWGIITHTKMFEKYYREEVKQYLAQWEILDKVKNKISEEIDGISRDQLLRIAIIFHDLGKFTERKLSRKGDGSFAFNGHEAVSGKIIREREFSGMLKKEYELTENQIEYIARCAELHYQINFICQKENNTIAFTKSENFNEKAKNLMDTYKDLQLEIGLLFLGDLLSKTEVRISVDTDNGIEEQAEFIKGLITKRKLSEDMINVIKQFPINLAFAENYLKIWANKDGD